MPFKIVIVLVLFVLSSCKKEEAEQPSIPDALKNGALVLNEGLFQQNSSHLSWVNFDNNSVNNIFFAEVNNRPLGDTGNDIQIYDGRVFVVMNVSSTIEILSATNGKLIKQVSMLQNGIAKQPRYIIFNQNKAYISCYDGYVDVLNLDNYEIETRIKVGQNPEQLKVSKNKLYVANSGGLNFPNVDSTVSVIDLSTRTELIKITVGLNPGSVEVDAQGNVFVISRGDFNTISSKLNKIDTDLDQKVNEYYSGLSGMEKMNDFLLISRLENGQNYSVIDVFDPSTSSTSQTALINLSGFATFYGMQYIPASNQIACFDANGYTNTGSIQYFSNTGVSIKTFEVGLIPKRIISYE